MSTRATPDPAVPNAGTASFRTELLRQCPALQRYARQLTRNSADACDLLQATVERALAAAARYRSGSNLGGWLRCIMRNLFRDHCRHRARLRALSTFEVDNLVAPEQRTPTLPDVLPQTEIDAAIDGLRPFHREIVHLAYRQRLSQRAIAERLRIPLATAGVRLWRAKAHVRRVLEAKWSGIVGGQLARVAGARQAG